jgi:hypothetical protein
MTPDGLRFEAVIEGGSDPDAYFAERGFVLRVAEQNRDSELPPGAWSPSRTHWADLLSARTGEVVARSYGGGLTGDEAKARAVSRWIVEQEPPADGSRT